MRQETVVETLHALEAADIRYCVLRNYEFVTGEPIDGDVDVLVRENQRERVVDVLDQHGYRPTAGDTTRQTRFRRFVPDERAFVVIDVYWDAPTYNGLPILDGTRTLEHRRRYPEDVPGDETIFVPRAEEYFVELVFHGALNKNRYREFYRAELERLRTEVDRDTVLAHGADLFGAQGRRALELALDGNLEAVVEGKWRLVLAGCRSYGRVIPLLVWNLVVLREVVRPLRSLIRRYRPGRPAPLVALLGPDGAGKTTVARQVAQRLQDTGVDSRVAELGVYNDGTKLMTMAKQLRDGGDDTSQSGATDSENDSSHPGTAETDARSLGSRRSPVTATVHLLDIWLRARRARSGTELVVADRYVHDILLYDDPGPLERLFGWFERPPFLGIVLTGPVEVVAARSEYDAESIERMYQRLEQLDFEQVDVDQPVEDVVADVLELIADEDHLYEQFD
jgi:thymidylate kinase